MNDPSLRATNASMPSRVPPNATREAEATASSSPPSESEQSFVSADSASASASDDKRHPRPTKGSRLGQSAKVTPSSQHHSVAAASLTFSPKHSKSTTNTHSENALSPTPSKRLNTSLHPSEGSYFTQQPGVPGVDLRLQQARRPPASRSSHGIETKSGPPPALSTQRSYSESPWRVASSATPRAVHPPLKLPSDRANGAEKTPHDSTNEQLGAQKSKIARVTHTRPSTSDGVITTMEARDYRRWESEERDSTLRISNQHVQKEGHSRGVGPQKQSLSSHEDLFLNLARDDSVREESLSRSERRRSRIGPSSFSQARESRPSSSGRPSTSGGQFGGHTDLTRKDHSHATSFDSSIPRSPGGISLASLRDPPSTSRPYAASAHPLDQRHRTRNTRSSFGTTNLDLSTLDGSQDTPMPYGRRRSIRESTPIHSDRDYKQSHLAYTANGDRGSSPTRFSTAFGQESVRGVSHGEGTESTVSTTAPSTVWDEIDDVKSRLRKLERTGKLPKSSNAAISTINGDRPRTASTTVTTVSDSPKRRQVRNSSPEASTIRNSGLTNVHPLLHSALAKAKPMVKPDVYKVLEATASDALTLAAMTGSTSSQGTSAGTTSAVGTTNGVDRQLRRKADSMCRSLTELCIAMAEGMQENEASKSRPSSKDAALGDAALPQPKLLRGASDEAEPRASSRVMSRLEARRASLLSSSPLNGRKASPQEATTPTQTSTPISSRLDGNSSLLLRKRSNAEEIDNSMRQRSVSRAATEIGQVRPSPQTRISREYTSQHPMPGTSQQSPSLQPSLPTRKSYFASATSSPLTPNVQPGNRRYLDHSTPPSSADSARLAEARQRRIASLGRGQSRIGLSSGRSRQSESEQ